MPVIVAHVPGFDCIGFPAELNVRPVELRFPTSRQIRIKGSQVLLINGHFYGWETSVGWHFRSSRSYVGPLQGGPQIHVHD